MQQRHVTVWLSSEAIAAWTPRRRGGQRRYSDLAIETALTLRLLYHLPLRQAEGFLHALFGMMRLDLSRQNPYFSFLRLKAASPPSMILLMASRTLGTSIAPSPTMVPRDWSPAIR